MECVFVISDMLQGDLI